MFDDRFKITPDGVPNDGIMFADLQKEDRSGHLGHALIEYEPGKVIAMYPTCSAEDKQYKGHSGYGWMEYRISEDGGESWSESIPDPRSKDLFDRQCGRTIMCEKAVVTDTGRIVLFYLNCNMIENGHVWGPRHEPLYAISDDKMKTVGELRQFYDKPARIFDARYHGGKIYVLLQTGARCSWQNEDLYIFVSDDDGESFSVRSKVGFRYMKNCFYGTMIFTPDERLIVYTYDECDEQNAKYVISGDLGYTWGDNRRAFFKKQLRNPQIAYFGGMYLMHGRSGSRGGDGVGGNFVLYCSEDGESWDEGRYLYMRVAGAGAYSNNVTVHLPSGKERLIIHTSRAYEECKTNVLMYIIDEK